MSGPTAPPSYLDWSKGHWSARKKPCWHCTGLTNLRDDEGQPAHLECAKKDKAKRDQAAAAAYTRGPTTDA